MMQKSGCKAYVEDAYFTDPSINQNFRHVNVLTDSKRKQIYSYLSQKGNKDCLEQPKALYIYNFRTGILTLLL
jgi:hypothetical protein